MMTSARLQVGLPLMPVVSSTHMQQMDWNVLPNPMLSDCKEQAAGGVASDQPGGGGGGGEGSSPGVHRHHGDLARPLVRSMLARSALLGVSGISAMHHLFSFWAPRVGLTWMQPLKSWCRSPARHLNMNWTCGTQRQALGLQGAACVSAHSADQQIYNGLLA